MDLEALRAAARAKLAAALAEGKAAQPAQPAQPTQPALPKGWVALGTCPVTGKPRYRTAPAVVVERKPSFAERAARWLEAKRTDHVAGSTCPHCNGTGRYRFHTDTSRCEKCFRCDGKGTLNAKDLAFLNKRIGGAGPVCWVVTAAAA